MSRPPGERFARLELIEWWRPEVVRTARLVVVGAGAIGNEVLKNCALLGLGRILVIDMDTIEASNLSRSVLFREGDEGFLKAEAAARGARAIFSELPIEPLAANVVTEVGAGVFRWADVVIGALDNREARLAVNRRCFALGKTWVDGGIDVLSGVARVFAPGGPCYECTMSETDWKILEHRRSCSLLMREAARLGHVPTTSTTASIVGAVQVQETLKLLHGLETLAGSGLVFDGLGHGSYVTQYQRNPDCGSHDALERVVTVAKKAHDVRVGEALSWAREELGAAARLELGREIVASLDCGECGESERSMRPLGALAEKQGECPHCGAQRAPRLFHSVTGGEDFLDATLAEVGVPPWDIVAGRAGGRSVGFELAGDRAATLRSLETAG